MITLRGIRKTYRMGDQEVDVLRGIDLDIRENEYVAIMGPSGSGKSTLMHVIGCLDRPTEGTYELNGTDVFAVDDVGLAAIRNRTIGFVFQQFFLLPRMNARQNVELPLVYAGVPRAEREKRALEALGRVGLAERKHHRPSELSGGQQQRVAIARALVNRPRILLADEPTGALDSRSGRMVLDLFDELHREGKTVVLITHDPEVAARAERVITIRDGQIIRDERKEGAS
ncbi:ABC transporter ATP-binding protein [Staphylospora marina]|uniref:ABC transporter ATP-binding protein n=1 Tax=Staphylospora marina TaxID=2490858 RepID=UPI000F5C1540|nr:ABC transporter ATP-binding protein [Staphylospora marina]